MHPGDPLGKPRYLALDREHAHQHDAHRLANKQAQHHAEKHRVGKQGGWVAVNKTNACVGEREQRHAYEIHPRMQSMLQTDCRGNHLPGNPAEAFDRFQVMALRQHRLLGLIRLAGLAHLFARPVHKAREVHARPGGDGKRQQHAGNGGVHARKQHAHP